MIIASRTKLQSLLNQESALNQSINTVKWQIQTLGKFSSVHQLRAFKKHRANLNIRLNQVKKDITALTNKINGAA